jgi:chloride channel 3/4/5
MLGGVTRLNVCLAVTMFEVTGSLIYIIPIMVSTVTSKLVGDLFGNHGIYDILVAWKRYPYIAPTAEADPTISAQVVMSSNPVVLYAYSETLESISTFFLLFVYQFPNISRFQLDYWIVTHLQDFPWSCQRKSLASWDT